MTASSIPVGDTGERLQTWENEVGGLPVHTEATTPTHTDGVAAIGEVTPLHKQATSSGETTVHTPAAGMRIRLSYYAIAASPANSANVGVGLRWGTGSTDWHFQTLSQHGGVHASHLGQNYIQGAADEALIVNLSAAETVDVNIRYEEVS